MPLSDDHRQRTVALLKERKPDLRRNFGRALDEAIVALEQGQSVPFTVTGSIALTEIKFHLNVGENPLCLSEEGDDA